jgi:hypothetical protein
LGFQNTQSSRPAVITMMRSHMGHTTLGSEIPAGVGSGGQRPWHWLEGERRVVYPSETKHDSARQFMKFGGKPKNRIKMPAEKNVENRRRTH